MKQKSIHTNPSHPTTPAAGSFRVGRFLGGMLAELVAIICGSARHGGALAEEQKHWEY